MLSRDDEALLNDLLDDRLSAADEAALSARLEREPALREAWDELVRAREFLRDQPDPVPPGDFTALVRARLAAAPTEEPAPLNDGEPQPRDATLRAAGPAAAPIPLAWRRLMTVAYAAAAALIVGIGVLALKDRGAARESTVDMAREGAQIRREAAPEKPLGDKLATGGYRPDDQRKKDERERSLEGKDADASSFGAVDPVAAAEAPPPAAGAAPKPRLEGNSPGSGAAGPLRGPGGQVPPGLREPSDKPTPLAPAGPAGGKRPAPKKEQPGRDQEEGDRAPAAAPDAPALDAAAPDASSSDASSSDASSSEHALGELLVLEATSLDAGRRLLESVVAGPGARPAAGGGSGPQGTALPTTAVSLRRLDPRRDANLLLLVKAQDAGARLRGGLAAKAKDDALPPAGQPPVAPPSVRPPPTTPAPSSSAPIPGAPLPGATAPTPPSAPRSTPAPAPVPPAEPAAPRTAGRGVVPVAPLLGVVPRTLTAEEYARLAALLGPADGFLDEKAAKSAETLRRVRVLIVQPPAAR